MELNEREKQKLLRVLSKDPSAITEADKTYLRARRQYVGKRSQKKFAFVFEDTDKTNEDEE